MSNPFQEMFERFKDSFQPGAEYEPVAPLSTKESKEWDNILLQLDKARSKLREAEAKRQLFWARMEQKIKMYDRGLKIEGGMIMALVEKKNNCGQGGNHKPIEGFCDGDCENCAINPNKEDDEDEA